MNEKVLPQDKKRSKHTKFPMSDENTRDGDLGIPGNELRIKELLNACNLYAEMLRANHEAISRIAFILNKSQPPAPGKIEVRMWGSGGKYLREARVTMYGNKPKPEKIPATGLAKRASKTSSFQRNYDDTCLLLNYLEQLLGSRELLKKYMNNFTIMLARFRNTNHQNLLDSNKFGEDGVLGLIEQRIDKRNAEETHNPERPQVQRKPRKARKNMAKRKKPLAIK